MHSAPAVSYPVGRSRFQGLLVGLIGMMGAVLGLLWRQQADLASWRQVLFFMTLLGACVLAFEAWRRSPLGTLRWDGQAWSWACGEPPVCGRVSVHLDLQFCMVLRLRTDSGRQIWLWPERRTALERWNPLRRAVFARAGVAQVPSATATAQGIL